MAFSHTMFAANLDYSLTGADPSSKAKDAFAGIKLGLASQKLRWAERVRILVVPRITRDESDTCIQSLLHVSSILNFTYQTFVKIIAPLGMRYPA
jgi:hypothetical protein